MKHQRLPPWLLFLLALATAISVTPAAGQQPAPFARGNAAAGKVLTEKDCVACHERMFGDAATIYARSDRKVRNPEQLLSQIRVCNSALPVKYFPEEEEHVAAYLTSQYYKFTP
jgi:cytochrome c553